MVEHDYNRGIRFLAGPGLTVKNVAGAVIYEALPQRIVAATVIPPHPLKLIPATSRLMEGALVEGNFLRVINGRAGGVLPDGTMGVEPFYVPGNPNDLDFVYSEIPMAFDADNEWCDPTGDGAIYFTPTKLSDSADDMTSYLQIGRVHVDDDGVITVIEQNALGNLTLERSGIPGNVRDRYRLGV